ncbi:MAG TPA: glycosyltransferase family 4 protein [Rhodanobacteraceae bacterium]|nr:glycosyltransferase family 4 protein [Rhodanobacteraceae bacterium]
MKIAAVDWVEGDVVSPRKNEFDAAHAPADAASRHKTRLLVFTSLYPNAAQPRHGVFVEERLRHLLDSGRVAATVVAPVPWFPFKHQRFGTYAAFARVPEREQRHGMQILHPRYPVIPKVGMSIAPALMYRALLPVLRNVVVSVGAFDIIDAHYFYPDGVVAAWLGEALGKPVVITARGSDVNQISRHRLPRRQMQWAAEHAAAVVTVSQALKDKVAALGVNADKITVLRNGVDLERFQLRNRASIRAGLGLTGPVWLAVGHLVELKGVHLTLAALAKTPDATLLIAGEGPEKEHLRQLVGRLGIGARVRFLGTLPQVKLCDYYNAADALVLASSREGMPNVMLESLACGTPVIAAPFESAAEVINTPAAGVVAAERSAEAIASAWLRLRDQAPARAAVRSVAERLGWGPIVDAQCALYAGVVDKWSTGARSGAVS